MMPSPGKDGAARAIRPPSLWDAVIPLVVLTGLLSGSLVLFGLDALDGPIQTALVLCVLVAGLIALKNGYTWEQVEQSSRSAMSSITSAIFILLAVGALIGVWNLSGTIPTLVYYGIEILSPSWYFAATALICGLVALSIGSSWTTAGTIGVGLVGIATMIGVSPEITAGAVISGAYLGDKLSPLSETTILTANIVGVDVHAHVRRQAWTSVPAFGVAVVVFVVLGLVRGANLPHDPTALELRELRAEVRPLGKLRELLVEQVHVLDVALVERPMLGELLLADPRQRLGP
jgi:NhaC family Na+:H+ antiporter